MALTAIPRLFCRFAFVNGAAIAMLVGCAGHADTSIVPGASSADTIFTHHHTFKYTGAEQLFQAPSNVTQISVVAHGGNGAGVPVLDGGRVTAYIPVTPYETLAIYVGGTGSGTTGGFNGAGPGGAGAYGEGAGYGGGGASDVREGGDKLANRILRRRRRRWSRRMDQSRAAQNDGGGGKGGGNIGGTGGVGYERYLSSCSTGDGTVSGFSRTMPEAGGCGGTGGTQSQGGAGGSGGHSTYGTYGLPGDVGGIGYGGGGGAAGGGSGGDFAVVGGGGGGGYYGGGGGGGAGGYSGRRRGWRRWRGRWIVLCRAARHERTQLSGMEEIRQQRTGCIAAGSGERTHHRLVGAE